MNRTIIIRALLTGSAFTLSNAAFAQAPAATDQPATTQDAMPDASDAAADAAIAAAGSVDDAQAKTVFRDFADTNAAVSSAQRSAILQCLATWKEYR